MSGVNIKLEKTGGIREALRAIHLAKEHNLKIWIGMMVASGLSSNIAAHLLPLADYGGDLDGSLLVEEESELFEGGFTWDTDKDRGTVYLPSLPGIGMRVKQ